MHRKLQASSEVDIPTWNFFKGFNQDDTRPQRPSAVYRWGTWFRLEGAIATSFFGSALQKTESKLSKVDLELPEELLIRQSCAASKRTRAIGGCWTRVSKEVFEPSLMHLRPGSSLLCSSRHWSD